MVLVSPAPHPRWDLLLQWLARCRMDLSPHKLLVEPRLQPGVGYGLFASAQIPPSTPVFTVPASALLNSKTLSSCYPSTRPKLSATQLISLHLFLHQPDIAGDSSDPLFGPYISVLPRDFESHPLTWFWRQLSGSSPATTIETRLLDILPASVAADLKSLAKRLFADWRRVFEYLQEHPAVLAKTQWSSFHLGSPSDLSTTGMKNSYLWSWLNVNTRCIYHRIKSSRSDPDNMTLCPILDFANHTSEAPVMSPQLPHDELQCLAPAKLGGNLTLLSPADSTISQGSELHLTYGAHPNRKLFIEYGFVENISPEAFLNGKTCGEVDVQQAVGQLFKRKGEVGVWMENCLKNDGYWGDWTMHSSPPPAHPSFRLITVLRLYRCVPTSANRVPPNMEELVERWRDTLLGKRDTVSAENESLWRATLQELCEDIANDARLAISRLKSDVFDGQREDNGSVSTMKENIEMLWQEELCVAMAVAGSVRQEVQF